MNDKEIEDAFYDSDVDDECPNAKCKRAKAGWIAGAKWALKELELLENQIKYLEEQLDKYSSPLDKQ